MLYFFNFEHMQQINLIFLLLTLKRYVLVWGRIRSTKKLKYTLNNGIVSLKTRTCDLVRLHGLNNR